MKIPASCLLFAVLLISLIVSPDTVKADTTPLETVESKVRSYFASNPVMIEIARCESKFTQHNADGTVLRGGWGKGMVGVFQFYESVHKSAALALGFDLSTLEGNLKYAEYVYTMSGTTPWNSSKGCWGSVILPDVTPKSPTADLVELQAKVEALMKVVDELTALNKKLKVATL